MENSISLPFILAGAVGTTCTIIIALMRRDKVPPTKATLYTIGCIVLALAANLVVGSSSADTSGFTSVAISVGLSAAVFMSLAPFIGLSPMFGLYRLLEGGIIAGFGMFAVSALGGAVGNLDAVSLVVILLMVVATIRRGMAFGDHTSTGPTEIES